MTLINGEDKQYYKVGENTLTALNTRQTGNNRRVSRPLYPTTKNKLYFICHFHAKVKSPLQSITAGFFTLFLLFVHNLYSH